MSRKPERKTRPLALRIVGTRGGWTADVEGVEMGVLHTSWRNGPTAYFDPMTDVSTNSAKHARLVQALEAGDMAVVQRDKEGDPGLGRDGYVGIFRFTDLSVGADKSIRLTFVDRVQ